MAEHLTIIRLLGFFLGLALIIWSFARFRVRSIRRGEFFAFLLFGSSILTVAVAPDTVNIIAGMMALEDQQFGRLIALLVLSNMLMWILIIDLRSKKERQSRQLDLLIRALAKKEFLADEAKAIHEITIIIPVLDEAENLTKLLPGMPKTLVGHECCTLIVDDGSTDSSAEVAASNGCLVLSSPFNRGGGAALRLGYDVARCGGAKIIVTMDGDGQHLPENIEGLVKPILDGEADVVIGSRILGSREKDSPVRWIGIWIFNLVINFLAGTRITDCSSGFRAFHVESLQKILLLQDQFHTAELIIDAAKNDLRIAEVPVTIKRRYSGASKKGKNWVYGINFSKTVVKTWLRK